MTTTQTTLRVSGTTYSIRELLKDCGGRYDAASKTWTISAEKWEIVKSHAGLNKRGREIARAIDGCVVEPCS